MFRKRKIKHNKTYAKQQTKRKARQWKRNVILISVILALAVASLGEYLEKRQTEKTESENRQTIERQDKIIQELEILLSFDENRQDKRKVLSVMIERGLTTDEIKTGFKIIQLESKWNKNAENYNGSYGTDRGIWQLNDYYHDYSLECAYNVECSTGLAIDIYEVWGNWEAWTTYNNFIR